MIAAHVSASSAARYLAPTPGANREVSPDHGSNGTGVSPRPAGSSEPLELRALLYRDHRATIDAQGDSGSVSRVPRVATCARRWCRTAALRLGFGMRFGIAFHPASHCLQHSSEPSLHLHLLSCHCALHRQLHASPPTIIICIMSMHSSMPCMRRSARGAPPGCLRLAARKLRVVRRKLADLASMEVVLSARVGVCHVRKGKVSCTRIASLHGGSSWASQNRGGLSILVGHNPRSPTLTTSQADRRFRVEAACEIAHDGAHRAAATHLAPVAPRCTRRTSAVALLSAGSPAA